MLNNNNAMRSDSKKSSRNPQIEYDSVCQSVGHLYLDSIMGLKSQEQKFSSMVENLTSQVETLIAENEMLKIKIEQNNERDNKEQVD